MSALRFQTLHRGYKLDGADGKSVIDESFSKTTVISRNASLSGAALFRHIADSPEKLGIRGGSG
jgi:hypothetical protein